MALKDLQRGESVIPVLHHMCRWAELNRDSTNAHVPHCQHCEDWIEEQQERAGNDPKHKKRDPRGPASKGGQKRSCTG